MSERCTVSEMVPGDRVEFSFKATDVVGACYECIKVALFKAQDAEAVVANDDIYGTQDAFYGGDVRVATTTTVLRTENEYRVEYLYEESECMSDDPDRVFSAVTIGSASIECSRLME